MIAPPGADARACHFLAGWLAAWASACAAPTTSRGGDERAGARAHEARFEASRGVSQPLFADLGGPVTIGPAPAELTGTRPADCEPCHAEIVSEWRSSMHARAWTDPIFQNEYRVEPHPSCRGCHAPGSPADQIPVTGPGRDGISCAVCHMRAQTIFGAPVRTASGRASDDHAHSDGAHPVRALPRLATSEFCAPCHQFHFPAVDPNASGDHDGTGYDPNLWLQDTYNEWTRSQAAADGRQCQDCHMSPTASGNDRSRAGQGTHRSHRFAGMRDPALLARSVDVQVAATHMSDHILVRMYIRGADIGHALPTGDMFRQLVVQAWLAGSSGTMSAPENLDSRASPAQLVLKRWFAPVRQLAADGSVRYVHGQRADTRVPPPGPGQVRVVELTLPTLPSARQHEPVPERPTDRHGQVLWRIELWAREPHSSLLRGVARDLAHTVVQSGRVAVVADPGAHKSDAR